MKTAIAATIAVAAGLLIANMLGVAAAEAPTATSAGPVPTVSVEGVATLPIAQGANLAEATAVYRQGMANAVADGLSKAEFLAGKAGATLGSVQSIVEDGGSIECTGVVEEEGGYSQGRYLGEQPDFGSPGASGSAQDYSAPAAAATPKPALVKKKKKKKKTGASPTASKSSAITCTLSAAVSLVYVIS
jgi:predicted RecA/RadA family phage recombinase